MKRAISLLLVSLTFISCDLNDEESYSQEILPVAKVEMQTAFAKDSTTTIIVKYLRPSNCHFYDDFFYERQGFTRIIAIYSSKLQKDNCQTIENDTIAVPMKFRPTEIGTYLFKFWKGTNASGEDTFYEHAAIVNH